MPRNSSGSYTLPASNPVQTHTTITSNWANGTLADVSAALSASLDRYGNGAMVAALALANGSSALPALTFSAETASGLFRNGSQDLEMSINGTVVQKWLSTGIAATLGAVLTQSQANTVALVATGNGTAAAATLTGGSSNGSGVTAQGGGTSGAGVTATGGSSTGVGVVANGGGTANGVTATGGATNGNGLVGQGGGTTGVGVRGLGGSGNAAGGVFVGGSTGDGLQAQGSHGLSATGTQYEGVLASGAPGQAGVRADPGSGGAVAITSNGNIDLSGAATASTTTADRQLTPSNLIRAAARCTYNGNLADPIVSSSFNVSAVKYAGSANTFYVDLSFNAGTAMIPVFTDIGTGGLLRVHTVEVSPQAVVGSKTRITFQTMDTTTGNNTNPGVNAGFNLIVTGV